jgi:uncharacterized protein YbaP (TraB family)
METLVLRRDILSALATAPLAFGAGLSIADPTQGPHFYQVSRKNGRVFLLGFGEATDDSWFSPRLQKALDDSSSLWLENGNQGTATAETKSKIERLGHQSRGRTFFDELEPRVRDRTATYMRELGIQADALEGLRPWRAYYAIVNAFYANRRPSGIPLLPDKMLAERSAAGGKPIFYEMPTALSFAEFMAGMSSIAQSQYIEWLLDYLDDVKAGRVIELDLKWTHGDFAAETRSLDRMRTRMPALYRVMQLQRNAWWARKINALLTTGQTHFVAVGNLHAMGPDGIPAQLIRGHLADLMALES